MRKATTPVSLVLCLSLCTLPGALLSQTQEPQSAEEAARQQRTEEQRLKDEEERKAITKTVAEYSDEAWQDMLGVTPEQEAKLILMGYLE